MSNENKINHICDKERDKCYKCHKSICLGCMNKIPTHFGDYVCNECYEDKEGILELLKKSNEDMEKAFSSIPTNELN